MSGMQEDFEALRFAKLGAVVGIEPTSSEIMKLARNRSASPHQNAAARRWDWAQRRALVTPDQLALRGLHEINRRQRGRRGRRRLHDGDRVCGLHCSHARVR